MVLKAKLFNIFIQQEGNDDPVAHLRKLNKSHTFLNTEAGLLELGAQGLSKSISGPSNFTRLQPVGPVQNKICVCLDKRDTHSL